MTAALPCLGHAPLYDAALYDDDTPPAQRAAALQQAARLCAGCPAPCDQQVTPGSTPAPVVELPDGWMPPRTEGRPEPVVRSTPVRRREYVPPVGRDYIPPDRRPAAWARMAAELDRAGMPLAGIADRLCVDEATARLLLAAADTGPKAPREPKPCGTLPAYKQHLRHGEAPCDPCREANTEAKRGGAKAAKRIGKRKPIAHGTPKGAKQHYYRGEQACAECLAARRRHYREQTAA